MRLLVVAYLVACGGKPPPPVAPGPPISAAPDLSVGSMQEECDGLVAALETWKQCTNLEEGQKGSIEAWIERAHIDFAAAVKAQPEARAQHEIALRCHRAAGSIKAATERCGNGKVIPTD
jgi:hypothetical protein